MCINLKSKQVEEDIFKRVKVRLQDSEHHEDDSVNMKAREY